MAEDYAWVLLSENGHLTNNQGKVCGDLLMLFCCVLFWEAGSHYVALAVLEFTV